MSDFLDHLVTRSLGLTHPASTLQPRPLSLFETPAPPAAPFASALPSDDQPLDVSEAAPVVSAVRRARQPLSRGIEGARETRETGEPDAPSPQPRAVSGAPRMERSPRERPPVPAALPQAAVPPILPGKTPPAAPKTSPSAPRSSRRLAVEPAALSPEPPRAPAAPPIRLTTAPREPTGAHRPASAAPALEPAPRASWQAPREPSRTIERPSPLAGVRPLLEAPASLSAGQPAIEPLPAPLAMLQPRVEIAVPFSPALRPDEPAPVIQVTIGRVEVRATPPPSPASARRPPAPAVPTLDEYLRRRNRRDR